MSKLVLKTGKSYTLIGKGIRATNGVPFECADAEAKKYLLGTGIFAEVADDAKADPSTANNTGTITTDDVPNKGKKGKNTDSNAVPGFEA